MKPPRKPKLLTIRDAMNRLSTYTDLCGFTEIEDEAARVLSSEYKKHPLYLNGLTSLTPSAAEALAQHKGKRLHLNGIISLTSPAAAALSLYQGEELFLSSLHFTPAISAQLVGYKGNISVGNSSLGADLLETFRSHKGRISIDSVTHLTDEEATVLAELISQGKVILNIRKVREFTDSEGHQSLLREIVKKSSKKGTLFIDGAKQVSPQSLQILSEFDGADLKAEPDILKQLIKIKRRNVVRLIERGKLKEPREWKSGCIQLNAPPLKSLKGRDSARCDPTQSTWWLPERVLNWFLQNLDPTHKTRAWERNEKSKRVYISPEANQALRKNAVEWMWICGGQQADAKPHASALLTPENQPEVPREWQDESIVLPPPSAAK
ncbi:MAG: hypothetical protein EBS01_06055 [Verrucomicrobia bacterium]|nr:hypothetical protein [Verrucomicrobiota bacterium]